MSDRRRPCRPDWRSAEEEGRHEKSPPSPLLSMRSCTLARNSVAATKMARTFQSAAAKGMSSTTAVDDASSTRAVEGKMCYCLLCMHIACVCSKSDLEHDSTVPVFQFGSDKRERTKWVGISCSPTTTSDRIKKGVYPIAQFCRCAWMKDALSERHVVDSPGWQVRSSVLGTQTYILVGYSVILSCATPLGGWYTPYHQWMWKMSKFVKSRVIPFFFFLTPSKNYTRRSLWCRGRRKPQ